VYLVGVELVAVAGGESSHPPDARTRPTFVARVG
jgi:hypothetical protein